MEKELRGVMKLEKLALLAEVVSGVAIVITLIVLIAQVQENTDAVEAANRQSIAARTQQLAMLRANNQQLSDLIFMVDSIDLDSKEAAQLRSYYGAQMRAMEEIHYQYSNGRLDEEYFLRRSGVVFNFMNTGVARDWWADARFRYDPAFVEWLEGEMAERFVE